MGINIIFRLMYLLLNCCTESAVGIAQILESVGKTHNIFLLRSQIKIKTLFIWRFTDKLNNRVWFYKIKFKQIIRWFARFGEHDYTHTHDGPHQDVPIIVNELHPKYNRTNLVYDIAILYLKHDVIFNSMLNDA